MGTISMHELMYTMYVQILLLRHPGLFICYRILMCSLDSFSLFIFIHQVLCGYVWGWSQWLRSTEGSSRWNLPVRSRSFRSISIYLQTTQHWVCPNTHTVNSVICILQRQPPLESVLLQFSRNNIAWWLDHFLIQLLW